MSQHGILIDGRNPKSKKEIREVVAVDPDRVILYSTSALSAYVSRPASSVKEGQSLTFVGPDPFNKRDFYGILKRTSRGLRVE